MDKLKIKSVKDMIHVDPLFEEFSNEHEILDKAINPLGAKLKTGDLVENGTVEQLICRMDLDPMQPFIDFKGIRTSNKEYIQKELDWYLSEDLSIVGHVDDIKIWNQVCTKDEKKEVNSNYGWLVFNEDNGNQYDNCLRVLEDDPASRNAVLIYNRPEIYKDYKRDGMHDMICTMYSHFFIRKSTLQMVHTMRSNDLIFGFMNDFAWTCFVYQNMYLDLKQTYPSLRPGKILWQSDSMHVYPKHFKIIEKIVEAYKDNEGDLKI